MAHHCHATNCEVPVRPEFLMCRAHWAMVPVRLQRRVYQTYRRGQCDDRNPSREYLFAARDAVTAVAEREGLVPDVRLYDVMLGGNPGAWSVQMRRIVDCDPEDLKARVQKCTHGASLNRECVQCKGVLEAAQAFSDLRQISSTFTTGFEGVLNDLSERVNSIGEGKDD